MYELGSKGTRKIHEGTIEARFLEKLLRLFCRKDVNGFILECNCVVLFQWWYRGRALASSHTSRPNKSDDCLC